MSDYEPTKLDRIANDLIDAAIDAGLDASTLIDASMDRSEAEAYIRDCGGSWITSSVRLLSIRAMQRDDTVLRPNRFAQRRRADAPAVDGDFQDALTEHLGRLLEYEKPERPMFVHAGAVVSLRDLFAAMRCLGTDDERALVADYASSVWRCTASAFGMRDALNRPSSPTVSPA